MRAWRGAAVLFPASRRLRSCTGPLPSQWPSAATGPQGTPHRRMACIEHGDHGLSFGVRQGREPHGALLDVHDARGRIALTKDRRRRAVLDAQRSDANRVRWRVRASVRASTCPSPVAALWEESVPLHRSSAPRHDNAPFNLTRTRSVRQSQKGSGPVTVGRGLPCRVERRDDTIATEEIGSRGRFTVKTHPLSRAGDS
jgi:hypothetical protein